MERNHKSRKFTLTFTTYVLHYFLGISALLWVFDRFKSTQELGLTRVFWNDNLGRKETTEIIPEVLLLSLAVLIVRPLLLINNTTSHVCKQKLELTADS